jgi:hypothetical protein
MVWIHCRNFIAVGLGYNRLSFGLGMKADLAWHRFLDADVGGRAPRSFHLIMGKKKKNPVDSNAQSKALIAQLESLLVSTKQNVRAGGGRGFPS